LLKLKPNPELRARPSLGLVRLKPGVTLAVSIMMKIIKIITLLEVLLRGVSG